jgi:hypothetical protein
MSPAYRSCNGKHYRYYVSTDVLKRNPTSCPVRRVLAAEIENAVIDQLDRVVLRAGRLIVETATPGDSGWIRTLVRRWLRVRANAILRERFGAAESVMADLGIQRPTLRIIAMKKRGQPHQVRKHPPK